MNNIPPAVLGLLVLCALVILILGRMVAVLRRANPARSKLEFGPSQPAEPAPRSQFRLGRLRITPPEKSS